MECMSLIFVCFLIYYLFCLYVKEFGVSWIKPRYCIVTCPRQPLRNYYGEYINYKERYVVCRRVPFCFKEYLSFYDDNVATKKYFWHSFLRSATYFDEKHVAEHILKEILNKPLEYTFCGHL